MRWSEDEYNEYISKSGKALTDKPKKRPKYNNQKTKVDGITFDSKKEADYYCELKLLQRSGDIIGFALQPVFVLVGCTYRADFIVWYSDGRVEVIDVKGVRTDVYKVKIKQFRELYPGIKFREV